MRYIKLGHTGLDVSPITRVCESYGEPKPAAWLWHNPVVASLVGATKPSHTEDAVASLDDDEVAALETLYTPRDDIQGISNDADLARMYARADFKPADTTANTNVSFRRFS